MDLTFPLFISLPIIFGAGLVAGAMNAIAGGGSFVAFPTLMFCGVAPVAASATNTVALWPGSLAGTVAFYGRLRGLTGLTSLSIVSLLGGLLGAWLLLQTSDADFRALVPWLLLVATFVFTFGGRLTARWQVAHIDAPAQPRIGVWLLLTQGVVAIYGGYFGGGIGIMMLASLTIFGFQDIHAINGIKNWLASLINGVAFTMFAFSDKVYWPFALVMMVGAIAGGYGGGMAAQRLSPEKVRKGIVIFAWILTGVFFLEWGWRAMLLQR